MESTEKFFIKRVTEQGKENIESTITRERPLTIILNNQELVTVLCSPTDLKYLAIGFLSSEGLIKSKDAIKNLIVDERRGVVRVETEEAHESVEKLIFKRFITTGCGKGATFYSVADAQLKIKVQSQMKIVATEVFALVKEFLHRSQMYKITGGVHSAALCDTTNILLFTDDIGRHNAVDKIFGQCLLENIPTEERIIITTGRISSEILLKVARRNVPILISKASPTAVGVRLADEFGITLIGFVRGKRMNVYTNDWRVVTNSN